MHHFKIIKDINKLVTDTKDDSYELKKLVKPKIKGKRAFLYGIASFPQFAEEYTEIPVN